MEPSASVRYDFAQIPPDPVTLNLVTQSIGFRHYGLVHLHRPLHPSSLEADAYENAVEHSQKPNVLFRHDALRKDSQ